jgi:hypothetical protein
VPATGSLLVPLRHSYAARVRFVNAEWHVIVVWLGNQQLRSASHWSGGAQWLTRVPSTHGRLVTRFFSFRLSAWTWLAELGEPAHTFASALAEARGFVFVGKTPNFLEFRGLRIHGYTPPCL